MTSIRSRLLGSLLLVALATVLTLGFVIGATITQEFWRFVGAQRDRSQAASLLLADLTGPGRAAADRQSAANAFAATLGHDIEIRDQAGALVASAAGSGDPSGFVVVPNEGAASLVRLQIVGDGAVVSLRTGSVTVIGAGPLRFGGPPTPEQGFLQAVYGSLAIALLAVTALIGGVGYLLGRSIVQPVEALTAAAQRVRAGAFDERVTVHSRDELGRLATAFNDMAGGLQRAEYLRRSYIADIAHELRSPTANLLGYLEGIRDGVFPADEATIGSLQEEAVSLTRLVADLQEIGLADAGQLRLNLESLQIDEIVDQAVRLATPAALAKGVAIRSECATIPPITGDPQRLGQVVRNLVTNALTHTPAGGAVTVSVRSAAGGVEIQVADTGSGIAPEHLPYVFERFYRADLSRSRATGGSGLGLGISKQIVEAHGGHITIASTVGRGTVATVTLPGNQASG